MRQDWIEFKMKGDRLLALRPEYITKYSMSQEEGSDFTIVMYEEGDFVKDYYVNEPYEQVKQKIMDAEKVDLSDAVVEHFTREEYNILYDLVVEESEHGIGETYLAKLTHIKNKLNELKEEE